jgi:hypothetical protein
MVNMDLWSIFVHTSKESLICCNILRHGADGFTSSPKEGVLRNFIAFRFDVNVYIFDRIQTFYLYVYRDTYLHSSTEKSKEPLSTTCASQQFSPILLNVPQH